MVIICHIAKVFIPKSTSHPHMMFISSMKVVVLDWRIEEYEGWGMRDEVWGMRGEEWWRGLKNRKIEDFKGFEAWKWRIWGGMGRYEGYVGGYFLCQICARNLALLAHIPNVPSFLAHIFSSNEKQAFWSYDLDRPITEAEFRLSQIVLGIVSNKRYVILVSGSAISFRIWGR